MVFIKIFHHRLLSPGLLCSCGLWLYLDVQFVVFVLIFIYIDTSCPLHHGHTKVIVAKYNFCDWFSQDTQRLCEYCRENSVQEFPLWQKLSGHIPTSLWKSLELL